MTYGICGLLLIVGAAAGWWLRSLFEQVPLEPDQSYRVDRALRNMELTLDAVNERLALCPACKEAVAKARQQGLRKTP